MEQHRLDMVARLLRRAVEASPGSKMELEAWYEKRDRIEQQLLREFADVPLPNVVMHYLHDGDIRATEPEYRERQNAQMLEIVASLERGVIPPS